MYGCTRGLSFHSFRVRDTPTLPALTILAHLLHRSSCSQGESEKESKGEWESQSVCVLVACGNSCSMTSVVVVVVGVPQVQPAFKCGGCTAQLKEATPTVAAAAVACIIINGVLS